MQVLELTSVLRLSCVTIITFTGNRHIMNGMRILFTVCLLFAHPLLNACGGLSTPVYSGEIRYNLDPNNPMNCTAVMTFDFDKYETLEDDSIWINWGEGPNVYVHATSVTEDTPVTAFMGNTVIYKHVYVTSHIYDSVPTFNNGCYTISVLGQYALNGVTNIAQGTAVGNQYYIQTIVKVDTATGFHYNAPVLPVLTTGIGNMEMFHSPGMFNNADGDSVSFVLTAPLISQNIAAPEYQSPSMFCVDLGGADSTFTLNGATGDVMWFRPCSEGVFAFSMIANSYRNGQFVGSLCRSQNIYISANYVSGVKDYSASQQVTVYPNPATGYITAVITNPYPVNESVEVVDVNGRVVIAGITLSNSRLEANVSQLASGCYMLRLAPTGGYLGRFIKE